MAFRIRMADLLCDVDNRHDYLRDRCAGYIVPADGPADLTLRVSDEAKQTYIK